MQLHLHLGSEYGGVSLMLCPRWRPQTPTIVGQCGNFLFCRIHRTIVILSIFPYLGLNLAAIVAWRLEAQSLIFLERH